MKFLVLIGMCFGVLALVCPHLLALISPEASLSDPAQLGLLGIGLFALGMARKQQTADPNDD